MAKPENGWNSAIASLSWWGLSTEAVAVGVSLKGFTERERES